MMSFVQVFVILVTIGSGISQTTEVNTAFNDVNSNLDSIFDSEEKDQISLESKKNVVCDTKECQIIANEIIRGMNKSVDPCDDFYEFTCGTYIKQTKIPPYEMMWSRFHILQYVINKRLKETLETEPLRSDILPVRQAKKWYRSCLNITALENRGLQPLEAVLLQVGGWPMTLDPEEWDEDEHSWKSVEHDYFHITGGHVFYEISRSYRKEFAIQVEIGNIPLYRQLPPKIRNYTGNDYEIYTALISEVTELFVNYNKAAVTEEMIDNDARNVVAFEKELYMLFESSKYSELRNSTLAEFAEWYSANLTESELDDEELQKIDFENIIRRKFDLVNHDIQDSDILYVEDPLYFVELTKLLNRTPTRTIVNYIHWHFVSNMLVYTTEQMRDAFFTLMRDEFDVQKRQPRWQECLEEMKMEAAIGYAFVQKHFSQEVEEAAREMIENVRKETANQIESSNWMDEETKKVASEKLDNMKAIVGFPDWYKNETYVLNCYKGLAIGYDHFDNVLSFQKYKIKKRLATSEEMLSEMNIMDMIGPTVVNAYYDPGENVIILPAADFQAPLFTSRVPPSVNYGIIGLAAGHEIGHAFDSGEMENRWDDESNETKISEEMLEMYNEQAECFVDQFNKYFGVTDEDPDTEDEPSRGRRTRPDNIADSTGLQTVYKALKTLIAKHSVENYKLPGFEDYTDDQMFYIAFGSMWCEISTPKFKEMREKYDGHSPGRFRVIGSISNTKDFGEAFNCPIGSPMNPERKCNIWQAPPDKVGKSKTMTRRRRLGWIRKW